MKEGNGMAEHITTYMKKQFLPLNPKCEDVCIEDIAHALSLMTRANGHFPRFYSVAQHSLDCAGEAKLRGYSKRLILAALLHDASEAYLSDITRPVKKYMTQYGPIEDKMQSTIFEALLGSDLTEDEWKIIKEIDDTMLYYEFKFFMGEELYAEPNYKAHVPNFDTRAFEVVEQEFLNLYKEYKDYDS